MHSHPTVTAWLREDNHGFRIPASQWGQELYSELQCLLAESEKHERESSENRDA